MDGTITRRGGDAYELFMGRWSRPVADRFLDWLHAPAGADWVDMGSGTGALSAAILEQAAPRSVLAIDQSETFVDYARHRFDDTRLRVEQGDALSLPTGNGSVDVVVSGLFLNFLPAMAQGVEEMRRVLRPGGLIGFYVWDYPGGGMGMLDRFWESAASLDPDAAKLSERARFPDCSHEGLSWMCRQAGLPNAGITAIETDTEHEDFEDYWRPFTLADSTAHRYLEGLDADRRAALRLDLAHRLDHGGPIRLPARAWAVQAVLPGG